MIQAVLRLILYKKESWVLCLTNIDVHYYGMDVPTLDWVSRPILTVTKVRNTGETGDIYTVSLFIVNVTTVPPTPIPRKKWKNLTRKNNFSFSVIAPQPKLHPGQSPLSPHPSYGPACFDLYRRVYTSEHFCILWR